MARTMLVQRRTWNFVWRNINQVKVHDIHQDDCQWNLFIAKSTTECPTPIIVKSKCKIGVEQNEKH